MALCEGEGVANPKVPLQEQRRANASKLASREDSDAVGEHLGLVEEVGGQNEGPPLAHFPEQCPDGASRLRVHARRGLIEEERAAATEERDGEAELALLPSGERARGHVSARLQANAGERGADFLLELDATHSAKFGKEPEVLHRRERRPNGVDLLTNTERRTDRLHLCEHGAAVNHRVTGRWRHQACQH
eukprot:scaffold229164_cov27-Tisochrysis_lutea.AAC.5